MIYNTRAMNTAGEDPDGARTDSPKRCTVRATSAQVSGRQDADSSSRGKAQCPGSPEEVNVPGTEHNEHPR